MSAKTPRDVEAHSIPEGVPDRARPDLVGIVLTVLGIIQGLVFNQLAQEFARTPDGIYAQNNLTLYANFILCFVVMLRVFQTYLLAVRGLHRMEGVIH